MCVTVIMLAFRIVALFFASCHYQKLFRGTALCCWLTFALRSPKILVAADGRGASGGGRQLSGRPRGSSDGQPGAGSSVYSCFVTASQCTSVVQMLGGCSVEADNDELPPPPPPPRVQPPS